MRRNIRQLATVKWPPIHISKLVSMSPKEGLGTDSARETTEPIRGVRTGSAELGAMKPDLGVDPIMYTASSMEPSEGLEASGNASSEQAEPSEDSQWVNKWSTEVTKLWQAEDNATRVVISHRGKRRQAYQKRDGTQYIAMQSRLSRVSKKDFGL